MHSVAVVLIIIVVVAGPANGPYFCLPTVSVYGTANHSNGTDDSYSFGEAVCSWPLTGLANTHNSCFRSD